MRTSRSSILVCAWPASVGSDDCHHRLALARFKHAETACVLVPPTWQCVSGHPRHAGRLVRLVASRCWHGDDSFPPFHLQRHFGSTVGTQPEVLVFAVSNFEPKQLSMA